MTSFVKVVQNVLGQSVFSVKLAGQSDFVVQPDLSFNAGDVYTFDVSDPSMSGYSFVFGTEVDAASSIVTTYTTVNGTTIALNIPGDYTGGALYYFDNTNAGMGYTVQSDIVPVQLGDWQLLGTEFKGDAAGDGLTGNCISADGKTIAVSASGVSSNGYTDNGVVRVYTYVNNAWTQVGSDINGEATNAKLSVNNISADGNTVLCFSVLGGQGFCHSFRYMNSTWTKIGQDIQGNAESSLRKLNMSPDGNTVAIGDIYNSDIGSRRGIVQVYGYSQSNNTWTQLGQNIYGESDGDKSGYVSLSSDGTVVAIGAYENDGNNGNIEISGHVRVWGYSNNTWTQIGQDIDGITVHERSGHSCSLSADGTIVSIGCYAGDSATLTDNGLVRVYKYNNSNSTWTQLGASIEGWEGHFYNSNTTISADGTTVTFGTQSGRNAEGVFRHGQIRIYRYVNDVWTQVGSPIYGQGNGDRLAFSALSSDGNVLVVGNKNNSQNGAGSGHVRVFTMVQDTPVTKYTVTVSGDPAVFYIDGSTNPLTFTSNIPYSFDQSDPSNAGHTLVITSAVDSSVNLINYQTLYGTPGQPGAYTTFVATSDTVSYVSYEVYVSVPSLPAPVGDVYEVASISADVDDDTKTGATPALKRTFTRNAVTNMLNQYKTQLTGNKALKLAAGTKLPGFDIPATKEITLRDARVTKTYTRDEIANKTTYMVLNDNDPVTLKSAADDTVTVTQSGTNFTVVTPAGTTNKVAGDSFEYDGLSLLFGSLVVNLLLIPPVDMTLTAFDSAFVLSQQAILPDVSYALDVSAEITLTQQISAADLSGVFFFKTDEDITSELITDTSNVEYYLDRSQFTGGQATLNAMNGIVTTGYYGSNTTDHLGKDFLRDMAQQLFNTHFGVDLFTNEDAVITDISGKSAIIATDIFTKMGNVDKTNTALSGPDVSYGYYTTDTDSSNTNLTREILNQLLTLAPGRFTDKTTLRLDGSIPGVYGMPFVTNDTISYKLSVTAHADQNTTIATGKPGLETRSYKVIFKVA